MKPFDPLLNTGLRLGVVSLLIKLKSASFVYLKNELNATQGNLSVQLEKLQQGGILKSIRALKESILKPIAPLPKRELTLLKRMSKT